MLNSMPKFEVQVILERTYATVVIKAKTPELAREKVMAMERSEFDGEATDDERDILYVDPA